MDAVTGFLRVLKEVALAQLVFSWTRRDACRGHKGSWSNQCGNGHALSVDKLLSSRPALWCHPPTKNSARNEGRGIVGSVSEGDSSLVYGLGE